MRLLGRKYFLLLITGLVPLLHGAPAASERVLARIPLKGKAMLESLVARGIDILAVSRDGMIDVAVDAKELEFVRSLGHPVSVVATPEMVRAQPALDANLGLYHTYAEMETVLTTLAAAYPGLAKLDTMGQSIEGRNIYVLKISDNALVDEDEPEVLIMGNHHARELMSVEIPLKFAAYLLDQYGSDATVTDMVDNREIFIAPMVNPDGHVYVQNNHSGAWWTWWRKNRRDNGDGSYGVDPNRNYGYQWGYDNIGSSPNTSSLVYRGTGPFSEPETQAVRDFCNARNISVGFSYHSYGELLLYPWGYIYGYTPDHAVFFTLGDTLTSSNGYLAGNPAMGTIYITNGDTDDWAYGETGTKNLFFCFTPEVNTSAEGGFAPADTLIQKTFNKLLPMNMLLLALADNPYRVVGPYRPTMYAINSAWYPVFILSWSGNFPSDPNPTTGYELVEYKNLGTVPQDGANSETNLWTFEGFEVSTARAYEGLGSYYSGAVNSASRRLQMTTFLGVTADTDTFTCWVWYSIEKDYDYAYLEVSTDGGLIWYTVPGNITTNGNPNGANRGNGITGSSPGWVKAVFSLTGYLGMDIELRFNYVTDTMILGEGIYIDLPGPVPTFESSTTMTTSAMDTTKIITPTSTGEYTYRVRAKDAEDDRSYWSNSVSILIDALTAVGDTPALVSGLGPNYPNPFNPATIIPYTVGTAGGAVGPVPVTLRIYDVRGGHVSTLVDKALSPGAYRAIWSGKSDSGSHVSSGVYFARLTVGGETEHARKLVLLK